MNAIVDVLSIKYSAFAGRPRVPKTHFVEESLHQVPGIGEPLVCEFMRGTTMPEIRGIVGPGKASFAVDLGCGYGNLTMMLPECFDFVAGVDQCENKIAWARERWTDPALEFHVGNVTEPMTFENADLVHTSTVLQHLNLEDGIRLLLNVFGMLRSGGSYVANEGRLTDAPHPDALSLSQNHMHAKPLALFEDIGFRFVKKAGTLHVWRKP